MKTETIFLVLFITILAMRFLGVGITSELLILFLASLSMVYMVGGFYFFSDGTLKRQNIVLSIIAGVFCSFIPVGILFRLLFWQGGKEMLILGGLLVIILFMVTLLLRFRANEELQRYYRNMIVRLGLLALLAIGFFIVSTKNLLNIQYHNDNELVRLKTQYYDNPNNQQYKQEHDEYMLKHYPNSPEVRHLSIERDSLKP